MSLTNTKANWGHYVNREIFKKVYSTSKKYDNGSYKKGGTGLIGPDAPVISGTEKNQKVENLFGKLYCFH